MGESRDAWRDRQRVNDGRDHGVQIIRIEAGVADVVRRFGRITDRRVLRRHARRPNGVPRALAESVLAHFLHLASARGVSKPANKLNRISAPGLDLELIELGVQSQCQ